MHTAEIRCFTCPDERGQQRKTLWGWIKARAVKNLPEKAWRLDPGKSSLQLPVESYVMEKTPVALWGIICPSNNLTPLSIADAAQFKWSRKD